MMYNEIIKKYSEEYNKYIAMGLAEEDALTLVEKHLRSEVRTARLSPYELINLFAGEDVWKKTFDAFDDELNTLKKEVLKLMSKEEEKPSLKEDALCQCDAPLVEKKECSCKKKDAEVKVIADTPNHKEFRVTYPNGFYQYKMLSK